MLTTSYLFQVSVTEVGYSKQRYIEEGWEGSTTCIPAWNNFSNVRLRGIPRFFMIWQRISWQAVSKGLSTSMKALKKSFFSTHVSFLWSKEYVSRVTSLWFPYVALSSFLLHWGTSMPSLSNWGPVPVYHSFIFRAYMWHLKVYPSLRIPSGPRICYFLVLS